MGLPAPEHFHTTHNTQIIQHMKISIDNSNLKVWVIDTNGRVHSSANGILFTQYPDKDTWASEICAFQGVPYVLGRGGRIWKGNGTNWSELPGGGLGKKIAVNKTGTLYVIGMDDLVWKFNGSGWEKYWTVKRLEIAAFTEPIWGISLNGVPSSNARASNKFPIIPAPATIA